MKGFLICPVRGVDPAISAGHVARLEADGVQVHWPPRDTDQNDAEGLRKEEDEILARADAIRARRQR